MHNKLKLLQDEQELGPYSMEELISMAEQGMVSPDALVYDTYLNKSRELNKLPELHTPALENKERYEQRKTETRLRRRKAASISYLITGPQEFNEFGSFFLRLGSFGAFILFIKAFIFCIGHTAHGQFWGTLAESANMAVYGGLIAVFSRMAAMKQKVQAAESPE